MRAATVQASLRIRAVSPEPPLLAHTSSESRRTFRQKARSLAPLNGWACAVKICHDGMLEDTNSLHAAQIKNACAASTLQLDNNQMAFVIVVVFINIQLEIDESSQTNQRSVYENESVRNAAICVLIRIAQLVEHPADTDQLTFIKRHRAFESRKLLLLLAHLLYIL